jgi:hypothetical protein
VTLAAQPTGHLAGDHPVTAGVADEHPGHTNPRNTQADINRPATSPGCPDQRIEASPKTDKPETAFQEIVRPAAEVRALQDGQ